MWKMWLKGILKKEMVTRLGDSISIQSRKSDKTTSFLLVIYAVLYSLIPTTENLENLDDSGRYNTATARILLS